MLKQLKMRTRRTVTSALLLTPAFMLSLFAAYVLRFDGAGLSAFASSLYLVMPLAVAIKITVFSMERISRSWHAYVSFRDMLRLSRATLVSAAFLALVGTLFTREGFMPRSVIGIDACLTVILVGSMLSIQRLYREHQFSASPAARQRNRVLLVGLNLSGEAFLRAICSGAEQDFHVAGLVVKDARMIGREVQGVPVLATLENVVLAARSARAETVLIVDGELPPSDLRDVFTACQAEQISVRVLPNVMRIVSGQVDVQPRMVDIEDLLGRDEVDLDMEQLSRWLNGRRVLVTGSCGSIGSEIARQLLRFDPAHLVLVDRSETGQFHLGNELADAIDARVAELVIADICDYDQMQRLLDDYRPEVIFHAAAYKHVPLMEQHPREAVLNITDATCGLADLADQMNVKTFVMISTDKAVNPTSVMGCCKRVAEMYVQSKAKCSRCRFVTVRFGNVLDSAGSVVPTFRRQIAAGGPVTVTHQDMTRYFMTIPEASQLVIQAGAMGRGGEIFVLDMGKPVRIVTLAEDLIRLSGLQVGKDIELKITGLRPGEKLYEELYIDDEKQVPTMHPKILVAESEQLSLNFVKHMIDELVEVAKFEPERIREQLKLIVPRYQYESPAVFSFPATSFQPERAAA